MTKKELSAIQRRILVMVLEEGGTLYTEGIYDYVEERRPTHDEDGELLENMDPYETAREELGPLEGAGLLDHDESGLPSFGYSVLTEKGRKMAEEIAEDGDPEGLLDEIQEILWPEGDAEHQWSPDTLDEIAEALIRGGYCPAGLRE